ncbi:MAG: DUF6089 family protein [Cyclobacteriaceae bacterium]|nr:DUF6089 family protein [Cyclobacteriaceae bacterium]
MFFRLILLVCLALLFHNESFSQKKTEFGGGVGAFNYTGDLSKKYRFSMHSPAGTAFYKYHLSKAVNFRTAITAGIIKGSDAAPDDAFATVRGQTPAGSFRVFAFEASAVFEYNFIDLKGNNPLIFGSPYLFGGIGVAGFSGMQSPAAPYSPVQPVLPLGVGAKYVLNPKWYFGIEFGARVLFFDYLDNVSYGDTRYKNYQYGNWYDNDLYYFLGLTATYSLYTIPCPKNPYR